MGVETLIGFVAGLLIATVTTPVGISGAVFLLPVQLTVLGVPSPAVTPTNLLYNVVSVPGGLARYRRRAPLASPLTSRLLAGTLPGVVVGAVVRVLVVPDATVFRTLVGILLVPLGVWLLVRDRGTTEARAPRRLHPTQLTVLGFVAGAVGGIYGIGGGSLLAPVLVGLGYAVRSVAPAALVSTFVTSVAGVATFAALAALGHPQASPDWAIALACGLGGLCGGYLGASLQPRLSLRALTDGLGVLAVVIGAAYVVVSLS